MNRPRQTAAITVREVRQLGLLTAVTVIAVCSAAIPNFARGDASSTRHFVAASSDKHLWFVADAFRLDDRKLLCHHAIDMVGPYVSRTVSLSRRPALLAASGRRVWLVFPEREIGDEIRREVFTLRMEYDEAIEMYRPQPRDRLRVVDTLPGHGRLAGLVGTADGPVALIVPTRPRDLPPRPGSAIHEPALNGETGEEQRENDADAEDVSDDELEDERIDNALRPRLLLMESERWVELDLPHGYLPSQQSRLAVSGTDRDRLHLFSPDPNGRLRTHHFIREADGGWSQHVLDLDLTSVRGLTTVAGRLATVLRADVDEAGDALRLAYVRRDRLIEFGRFEPPAGAWTVLGMRDGLRLIDATTRDEVGIRFVDPITGMVREREVVTDHPLPAARLWHMTMMLTVAVFAVLLVLVVRPTSQEQIQVPDDRSPAPVSSRAIALMIDLVPGAAIAVLFLRAPPSELLRLPILMGTLDDALPHLVMLAVTLVHCTVTEVLAATTLGKAMLGLRVTNAEGQRAGAGQVLLRNLLKGLIFLIPPLAIFMIMNHYMQGVNDLVARTLILHPKPPSPTKSQEESQEEKGEG